MSILVGFVVSIKGTDVIIQMNEECNKVTYRSDGVLYHGVAIRECISIKTGIYNIVCKVDGEYIDQTNFSENQQGRKVYIRNVLVKPIGYIDTGDFHEGTKYLPMVMDNAYLMTDDDLSGIYNTKKKTGYIIGKTLKDDIPYKADFNVLFNKHIGIFGNTGSGKSNTLTRLYSDLFAHYKDNIKGKSQFILFDFNGEYTGKQIIDNKNKHIIELSTKSQRDTIKLSEDCFWDEDILGLLFKATSNTQKPFLKRLVNGRNNHKSNPSSLLTYYNYTMTTFLQSSNQKKEIKELIISILNVILGICSAEEKDAIEKAKLFVGNLSWNTTNSYFYYNNGTTCIYLNDTRNITDAITNMNDIWPFQTINFVDELLVRSYLQLVNGLLQNYIQFDHINPMINRIIALRQSLLNVISLSCDPIRNDFTTLLEVISFRNCKADIKKILPLIIAKSFYEQHKEYSDNHRISRTLHFIIDEAHNILSHESSREEESWKDYRLELFEEIIKEGRKFGVFMTIASQRPADISQTIMSQFHNFFIHRLVNDRDLALLDNAISSLDKISRSNIPTLPTGACVITGTSFILPLIIQIDRITNEEYRPASDDVDLEALWELTSKPRSKEE